MKEITCIECRGRGYIIVVDQVEPCPLCEGKGQLERLSSRDRRYDIDQKILHSNERRKMNLCMLL